MLLRNNFLLTILLIKINKTNRCEKEAIVYFKTIKKIERINKYKTSPLFLLNLIFKIASIKAAIIISYLFLETEANEKKMTNTSNYKEINLFTFKSLLIVNKIIKDPKKYQKTKRYKN